MRMALAVTVLFVTACKGDAQKCEQACRNFGTLVYWQNADKQIAAAPEGERDALRKKLLGQFDSQLENGVDGCVSQCQSANNDQQIDCMITAKTGEQASGCTK
jgi:hypothetical protein